MKVKNGIRQNGGITLISLIITIIVLLILAGITIRAIVGKNGTINKASVAALKTDIAGIEEEARFIYTEKMSDYYEGTRKEEPQLNDVIEELIEKGYEIISRTSTGDGVTGIEIDKKLMSLTINDEGTIKVTLKMETEGVRYYLNYKGKYYEIKKLDGGIKISQEESNIEEGEERRKLGVTIEGSSVTNYEINGNTIKIKTGEEVGSSKVKVTYGELNAECKVNVIVKPTSETVADETSTFSTAYGKIDIIWLDTNNNIIESPNSPKNSLTSNGESLKPVVFNSETEEWEEIDSNSSNWYNYADTSTTGEAKNTSKWANVKTANESYFVWIPRYAYRITYYESETSIEEPTGYYDGRGMWRAEDRKIEI